MPRSLQIQGAKIATSRSRTTTTPPAIATLSFLSRRQASWRRDRPATAVWDAGTSVMRAVSSLRTLPLKLDISA